MSGRNDELSDSHQIPDPDPDPTGFSELFADAAPAVFAWASLRVQGALRARCDAEDLLQEVCYRAFRGFKTFDPERGPFRGWIFGIANNVLREALTELGRHPDGQLQALTASKNAWNEVPDDTTSVSLVVARDEALAAFLPKLGALSHEERKLLLYRGLEGMSHQEVADLLDITVSNAEKRWERLLTRLRGFGVPETLLRE